MNTHYGMLRLDTGSSSFDSQPWILLESSPHQGTAIPTALVYVSVFNQFGYHLLHSTVSYFMSCYDISNYCTLGKPVCGRSEMSVLLSLIFHLMSHTQSQSIIFAADMFCFTRN